MAAEQTGTVPELQSRKPDMIAIAVVSRPVGTVIGAYDTGVVPMKSCADRKLSLSPGNRARSANRVYALWVRFHQLGSSGGLHPKGHNKT